MEEYEYVDKDEFLNLVSEFIKKEKITMKTSMMIYQDSKIKLFSRYNDTRYYDTVSFYRLDRKKFLYSANPCLRDYPNIVFSFGSRFNDYSSYDDVVKYSREIGFIVPHIKKMINDDNYRTEEKVMWALEN